MLYHPPTGGAPNDSYVGKTASTNGSKIPPAAIEYTQREIIAAIVAANLTPTDADLTQLAQAIAKLGAFRCSATGGTATALTTMVTPAPNAAYTGMLMLATITTTTGAAPTINFGFGAKPLVFNSSGLPLPAGALPGGVGFQALMEYDGTSVRVLNVNEVRNAASDLTLQTSSNAGITPGVATIAAVGGAVPSWASVAGSGLVSVAAAGLFSVNGQVNFGATSTNDTTIYYTALIYKNGASLQSSIGAAAALGSQPTTFFQQTNYTFFADVGDTIGLYGLASPGSYSLGSASINTGSKLHIVKVA